jgi:hypothetical protein
LLITTERASVPTRISIGSRPMALQASTSLSLMGRLAFEMSEFPCSQNRSKPPPDPIDSIVYSGPPSSIQRVTTRLESGNTVEDPAMPMSPEGTSSGSTTGRPKAPAGAPPEEVVGAAVPPVSPAVVVGPSPPPQATATRDVARTRPAIRPNVRGIPVLLLIGVAQTPASPSAALSARPEGRERR